MKIKEQLQNAKERARNFWVNHKGLVIGAAGVAVAAIGASALTGSKPEETEPTEDEVKVNDLEEYPLYYYIGGDGSYALTVATTTDGLMTLEQIGHDIIDGNVHEI